LELRQSRVLGQILTGCSMVRCPSDHRRYPNLPVVIFPGNVGDETALTKAYIILTARQRQQGIQQTA
ncbi:MAG: nucleotide-binding domain containing protein, partial [Gammaproteobacteria bacterium]